MTSTRGFCACDACGWVGRPRRLWCPRCGGRQWVPVDSATGLVRATTSIRRANGVSLDPPLVLALVRLDACGSVIAALPGGASEGTRVTVTYESGSFVARR